MPTPRRSLGSALAVAVLILSIAFPGCASEEGSRHRAPAHPVKPPPPLIGHDTFFDGRILAELKVGAGVGFGGDLKEDAGGSKGAAGGPARMSGGAGGMRLGAGGGGGGYGGGGYGGGGRSNRHGGLDSDASGSTGGTAGADHATEGPRPSTSMLPPVMIHLQFANNSQEHLDIAIIDFLSPLGNFVIIPEKLSLNPGQAIEVEPMTSRLDEGLESAEVTIAVHLSGRTERKTIQLRLAAPKPDAAPANPVPDQEKK